MNPVANKSFGEEYPAFKVIDGVRVSLATETRFVRTYETEKDGIRCHHIHSRIADGSASITAPEFLREWPTWTQEQRHDFYHACHYLFSQADYPEMLRFIMQHGGPDDWRAIALQLVYHLPCNEVFDFLLTVLPGMEIGRASNITQAIAATKHPDAEAILRRHLATVWMHPKLWDDDPFLNWVAHDATTCIKYLLDLAAPAADFEEQVRKLSQHDCSRNRDSCRRKLAKYYPWLDQAGTAA